MEVKIQIPDNCELIKDGDTYIVKEKKSDKPRTWEEFCENYPISKDECWISEGGMIRMADSLGIGKIRHYGNWINSKEEAEAFLALMQLRQLRKAWVGDWEQPIAKPIGVIHYFLPEHKPKADIGSYNINRHLSFPTLEMADEFLICFRDLCETAKILL